MMIDELTSLNLDDMSADEEALMIYWLENYIQGSKWWKCIYINEGLQVMLDYSLQQLIFQLYTKFLVIGGKHGDKVLYDEKQLNYFYKDVFKTSYGAIPILWIFKKCRLDEAFSWRCYWIQWFWTYVTISPKK